MNVNIFRLGGTFNPIQSFSITDGKTSGQRVTDLDRLSLNHSCEVQKHKINLVHDKRPLVQEVQLNLSTYFCLLAQFHPNKSIRTCSPVWFYAFPRDRLCCLTPSPCFSKIGELRESTLSLRYDLRVGVLQCHKKLYGNVRSLFYAHDNC